MAELQERDGKLDIMGGFLILASVAVRTLYEQNEGRVQDLKAEPQDKVTSTGVAIVASKQPAHYEFPRPAGKGKRTEKVVSPAREEKRKEAP